MSEATLQQGCSWVIMGWALRPTDFIVDSVSGAKLTAERCSLSWTPCREAGVWQRPREHNPDLPHLVKSIKRVVQNLPECDRQRHLWSMEQAIRDVAAKLVVVREQAETDVKFREAGL